MEANLWNSLEILSTQAALLVEWQQALGEDFGSARTFLRPTRQQADSYPCIRPLSCGCRHRVVFETEEDISAVCDCDEGGCDAIFLHPEDLIVHALNGQLLAAELCQVFQFKKMEPLAAGDFRSYLVGAWGVRRSKIFFNVPVSEKALLDEIDRLCPDPFILLTPTACFLSPLVQRALRRCGAAQISLAGLVEITVSGLLFLTPSGKETVEALLRDFGRRIAEGTSLERAIARVEAKIIALAKSRNVEEVEPGSDEVARRAFALVKELEPGPRTENPSFLTVFRLYCLNGMSAAQIAARCGCSKGTVINRLDVVAKRVGMPLARLRQYSSHFERMEDEISDSRAKEIDRWEIANGPLDDQAET